MEAPPDCASCRHHFVTWDAALPRGCRAFGIKTRALPALVVLRESGEPCGAYEPKQRPAGRERKDERPPAG